MITAAADLGNTRSKIFIFEDNLLRKELVLNNQDLSELETILDEFKPKAAIIGSVINEDSFEKILKKHEISLLLLNHTTDLPIKIDYKTPQTLGLDRIANAVGAATLFPERNVLVIDVGTCVKYDFISSEGIYLGGAISPGMEMRFKAMHNFTDKLPFINQISSHGLIGKSTIEAMTTGNISGMKHEIDGFISDYQKLYGNLTVILTGGDSKLFDKELKNSIFAHSFLTALGLNEILLFNLRA